MSAVSIHMVIKFPEDGHTRETHAVDRSPLPVGTRLVKKERKKKSFRNRKKKKKRKGKGRSGMERKGGNRWRTLRLGIAMKEHRAIESEGRRVGREKRERKIEREQEGARKGDGSGEERCPTTRKFP